MKKYVVVLSFLMISALLMSCSGGKTSQKKDILSELEWETVEVGMKITNYLGTDKVVEVPKVIEGKKVVEIGDEVFSGNVNIEQLILPDSVVQVGSLSGCDSLKVLKAPGAGAVKYVPRSVKELYIPVVVVGFEVSDVHNLDVLDVSKVRQLKAYMNKTYSVKEVIIADEIKYYIREDNCAYLGVAGMNLENYRDVTEITEENADEIYCEFFGNDTVIVNGKTYSR